MHIAALLLLNLCAHFIPLERAGYQPDDYFHVALGRGFALAHSAPAIDFESLDRPLNKALTLFSSRVFGLDTAYQAPLVLAGSSLLLVTVYLFLAELLDDRRAALVASGLYCLLPNKLELYGTKMYALYNGFLALYVLSVWLYLRVLRTGGRRLLIASVAAYAAAIASHEIGFLLPLVLLALGRTRTPHASPSIGWFALPAGVYALVRLIALTGAMPGLVTRPVEWASIATNVVYAVPNHYLGRYVARAAAYGIAGLGEMSTPWLACALLVDAGLVAWVYWRLRGAAAATPQQPWVGSLLLAAAALIAPACLHSVQGRHTALASIPLCVMGGGYLARLGSRATRAGLLAILLLVSQGDGWHNVVAGRITRAIFSSLEQHAAEIGRAERVLVDCRSFADAIPYTWGERERNVLHYYYAVPVLGSWGLEAMVALATGQSRQVVACASAPEQQGALLVCTEHFAPPGPERTLRVPRKGTFVLEFGRVYPRGFDPRNGRP